MLALLLLAQPVPAVATAPDRESDRVVHVDLIVLNQYSQTTSGAEGRPKARVTWYTSFWNVHMMPPWGLCRMPVFEHRGWCKTEPIHNCAEGYAASSGKQLIVAPRMIYLYSDFDFEYRNRHWFRPVNP